MKRILILLLALPEMAFALSAINLKDVSIDYKKGYGQARFRRIHVDMDNMNLYANHLNNINVKYKKNAYQLFAELDYPTNVLFTWATEMDFMKDHHGKIALKTPEPIQVNIGTRKSSIDVPEVLFATAESYMRFEKLTVNCSYPKGEKDPDDFLFHSLKACLHKGHFHLNKMFQMSLVHPELSEKDYSFLNSIGHDISERTQYLKKDLEAIRHIDIKFDKNQIYANLEFKFGPFMPKLEMIGSALVSKSKKYLKIHVSNVKLASIGLTDLAFKLLKNYKTETIRIDYPYVYIDISELL